VREMGGQGVLGLYYIGTLGGMVLLVPGCVRQAMRELWDRNL